jgi:hypothetical protein
MCLGLGSWCSFPIPSPGAFSSCGPNFSKASSIDAAGSYSTGADKAGTQPGGLDSGLYACILGDEYEVVTDHAGTGCLGE